MIKCYLLFLLKTVKSISQVPILSSNFLILCLSVILTTSLNTFAFTNESGFYQCQVESAVGENFDYAVVQLWAPPHSQKVRGILCLVLHPLDHGGSTLEYPEPWIKLANDQNCALMAISFAQSDDLTSDWCQADCGTGRALFSSLQILAKSSSILNLSTAPIVTMGICAAGQFSYHLAAFASDRIAAFVAIGGAKHDLSKIQSASKVPALIVITRDAGIDTVKNLESLYSGGRKVSAPWLRQMGNVSTYDNGMCSSEVYLYISNVLRNIGQFPNSTVSQISSENHALFPISIRGQPLLRSKLSMPSEISFPFLNSETLQTATCSFFVIKNSESVINSIFIADREPGLSTNVQEVKGKGWSVKCQLDVQKLPFGPLHLEVPIRFMHNKTQIFGGTTTALKGYLQGPVRCIPSYLNFTQVKIGKSVDAHIRILSTDFTNVKISSVTSTLSWVSAVPSLNNGITELCCKAKPPLKFQKQSFSGYLTINLNAPVHHFLRILYYGIIDK